MNSPVTGKPMRFRFKKSSVVYRKIECFYLRSWWEDIDTKEEYTTTETDQANLTQIHSYWESTRIPPAKESATHKLLRDTLNKYRSKLVEEQTPKLGKTLNEDKIKALEAKIWCIKEIQSKLF